MPALAPTDVDGLLAGAVGGVAGWVASALHGDLPAAARAAGSIVLPERAAPATLAAVGVLTHSAVAMNWGVVMSRFLNRQRPTTHGVAVGVGLFAFQYWLFGRCYPRIRSLPAVVQLADHLLYGAVTGAALSRLRRRRSG